MTVKFLNREQAQAELVTEGTLESENELLKQKLAEYESTIAYLSTKLMHLEQYVLATQNGSGNAERISS